MKKSVSAAEAPQKEPFIIVRNQRKREDIDKYAFRDITPNYNIAKDDDCLPQPLTYGYQGEYSLDFSQPDFLSSEQSFDYFRNIPQPN